MEGTKQKSSSSLNIEITCWNVRGMRKLAKLKQVLDRIKYLKSKIVFLQESHLIASEVHYLNRRWPGQVFHACYNTHARGVVILIHKSIPFQVTKTTQDPYGRYIIVQGNILSQKLNLINIYGPNEDNPLFFQRLFLTVSALEGHHIIGGDFNCALDPLIDRSTQIDATHVQTRKTLTTYMNDLRLIDVWRTQNPNKREYSCYSSSYKTHSRIDYFLISMELLSNVKKCWYNSIVISDHATVSMEIHLGRFERCSRWRLQVYLLQDPVFVKFVESCIDRYFELNTDETTASIRWEAFKAYIRGEIISYTSSKTKRHTRELRTLENQIKKAEIEIYNNNDPEKLHNLSVMRASYDKLTTDKVAKSLMWTKQTYYDQGEKAGKLLAWRIKKMQAERAIASVKTMSGNLTRDPLEINNNFRDFYKLTYKSEYPENKEAQNTFLDQLQFRTISEEEKITLDSQITITDLCEAIGDINSGKAPGPDGLPIEFYKTFKEQLVRPLLDMYEESFNEGTLPDSLRLAIITLILKPKKPPTECSSYRGISLMGCDTKILCKTLSRRLDKCLPQLIIDDQQGFVQKRQGYHNIRRVLNILHERHNAKDTAMLSVDACQAFDRIEWGYLFEVLPRFGFGETFLKWIQLLYTNPTAEILTNSMISKPFGLQRSTRQGCPLSPQLFTLAIEPLAMAVRAHTGLSGIKIGGFDHRISLYADDIIFFLTNLKDSIPNLVRLIENFGGFSGYKINNSKSLLMFLNKEERHNPIVHTPFVTTTEGFRYLGVKITPDLREITPANYDPLVDGVTESLNRWSTLPISMIGRINIIKMTILPKILYYFQTLPLPLPDRFCDNINKLFSQFIWNGRKARLRLKLLYLPYERGGLQLPNLKWYYMAAQLTSASYYFCTTAPPAWVNIEQESIPDLPLNLYLYSSDIKTLKKRTKNPFLKNTISVWHAAHKHIGDMPVLSQFTPIWGNEQFTPGKKDGGFRLWNIKGVQKMMDLYADGVLLSFDQLCQRYQIPKKHFFKYLQIKSYMSSKYKQIMCIPPLSKLEELTLVNSEEKGHVSRYYSMLVAYSTESALDKLKAWKTDIQEDIDETDWNDACLKAQTHTINTRFKLLQYKWLMRTYITPVKLHHMSANIPDVCVKCLDEKGTLFHCLWECPKIQHFWKDVIKCMSEIFNTEVPLNVKLCVLGIYPEDFIQTSKQTKLLDFGLLQARRAIALCWKSMDAPSLRMWMRELLECIGLERLTYIAKGKRKDFDQLWGPYMNIM